MRTLRAWDRCGDRFQHGQPMSSLDFFDSQWQGGTKPCQRMNCVSEDELYELRPSIPIIRVFRARAKRGCEGALAEKLATSSVEVVEDQPGFIGYLVAGPANEHQREFVFASIWADADAVKARFGREWRASLLPPGYAELIEECSVHHYHLTGQSLGSQCSLR